MNSNVKKKAAIFVGGTMLAIAVGAVSAVMVSKYNQKLEKQQQTVSQPSSQSSRNTVTYDGVEYSYNHNLTNILFMGVDKKDKVELKDTPGTAGQADTLMVISMDKENKTARILQIPRDTMIDVDI